MSSSPNIPSASYELDARALDVLNNNDFDFELDSVSTVSDVPGPGRTLDRVFGILGKAFESVRTKPLHNQHTVYDLDAGALDVLLDNHVDLDAASASTASDIPGPGRTLGKAISIFGKALGDACTDMATRMGLGPHAAMARLLKATLQARIRACHSEPYHNPRTCSSCEYQRLSRSLQSREPDMLVLLDAFILLTRMQESAEVHSSQQ
ncbi:hypothetical protein NEOLEDRAFT_842467 [Neolentinus lepideus HHB14362 ss-1]|uniref:Uncharacterized protein n=1 Tax=Neolentinus lepideus HHB14362 ss-1 TaxID=1314782 RepID=A0A165P4Z4_9AGAM|nr:hypothetical protein NEOLEDRAFT_842467 [Neolentinus lepideus HHB14362 ss-1]